ncbi:hypothetical protein EON65_55045 [archaeon]|nr:MAG: hypothetical protein EON65_55045 [archaeon]
MTIETAKLLASVLSVCNDDYQSGKLHGSDLVGIYILLHLALLRPKRWAGGKNKEPVDHSLSFTSATICHYEEVLKVLDLDYISRQFKVDTQFANSLTIMDIFNWLRLTGVKNPDNYINKCLLEWSKGNRPFCLLTYIPSPLEVLRQQARVERVVTIFLTEEELSQEHTSKLTYMDSMPEHSRNSLEFTVHDLKHMENFTAPHTHAEQVGFFRCMLRLSRLARGSLKNFFLNMGHDLQLWHELEYVLSDM